MAGFGARAGGAAAGHADAVVTLHDPVYVRPGRQPRRQRPAINILWIGRLEPQKDPLLALEIIAGAEGACASDHAGRGQPARAVEQRMIAALGLQDRVHLAWAMSRPIEPYPGGAPMRLLITSRYEGGPAVAVEALAHGRAGGQHRLFFPAARV